jgi:hypothetical protein
VISDAHEALKAAAAKVLKTTWQRRRVHPKVLAVAKAGAVTLAELIRWYIDTFESISPWQRSKQSALEFLETHRIGQTDPLTLTADILIDHVRQRRLSGLCPSTVWNDLCWIRVVLDAAKTAKKLPFPIEVIDEARKYCVKHRLIARSKRRERRPTLVPRTMHGNRDICAGDTQFRDYTTYQCRPRSVRIMLRDRTSPLLFSSGISAMVASLSNSTDLDFGPIVIRTASAS